MQKSVTSPDEEEEVKDGAAVIFRIGKVPCEFSREQLISSLTIYGKLLFL